MPAARCRPYRAIVAIFDRFTTDVLLGAVLCVVTLATAAARPDGAAVDALAVLVAVVGSAAVTVRRRFPIIALLVSVVAAQVYLLRYTTNGVVFAGSLIILYTIAEQSGRRRSLLFAVLGVAALAGAHALVKPQPGLSGGNLAMAALGLLAVAAGAAARNRHDYLAEVEARARRAEADREVAAAQRVTDERLRIARDLHDSIGHQLALINVQAGVAAHVLDSRTDQARDAIGHIRTASRVALDELRDTIGLLRQGEERLPTEPTVGLAGLPRLAASFDRAGLTVAHRVDGPPRPVSAPVDLTAYRVVQEALTNVCKHAGPTTVDVVVCYGDELLRVAVHNAPTGQPVRATGGHGLVGMRERVTALAGRLDAGPAPDGGFLVTAELPVRGLAA
jgi:signal transduction histidine kinase